jgi:hypothetical protein
MSNNSRALIGHPAGLPASLEGNPNVANLSDRMPYVPSGYSTILEEPGRRVPSADGRPVNLMHFNCAVALNDETGNATPYLFVKTGSGQHSVLLYGAEPLMPLLLSLESNQRFVMLHALAQTHSTGILEGEAGVLGAFLDGRVKKRKVGSEMQAYIIPRNMDVAA